MRWRRRCRGGGGREVFGGRGGGRGGGGWGRGGIRGSVRGGGGGWGGGGGGREWVGERGFLGGGRRGGLGWGIGAGRLAGLRGLREKWVSGGAMPSGYFGVGFYEIVFRRLIVEGAVKKFL